MRNVKAAALALTAFAFMGALMACQSAGGSGMSGCGQFGQQQQPKK